jgi:hypothetical protein
MEVSGRFHYPTTLLQGKEPPVSTAKEVVWAPEPVCRFWRQKSLFLCQESSDISLVVHMTLYSEKDDKH